MRHRKEIFAVDYIEETVLRYQELVMNCSQQNVVLQGELKWAHDVLELYFDSVSSTPQIELLYQRFSNLPKLESFGEAPAFIPYRHQSVPECTISYEQLLKLATRRRSTRFFLPKSVPRQFIDEAIMIASCAPSACNRQPFRYVIFDGDDRQQVAGVPFGTSGYAENIPVFIVVVGQLRHYSHERDRHLIYIDASLAAMSMLFAFETLGLSSCCINWPDLADREKRLRGFVQLDDDERPVMCIAVGYADPDGMIPYSQKKPLALLREYATS